MNKYFEKLDLKNVATPLTSVKSAPRIAHNIIMEVLSSLNAKLAPATFFKNKKIQRTNKLQNSLLPMNNLFIYPPLF